MLSFLFQLFKDIKITKNTFFFSSNSKFKSLIVNFSVYLQMSPQRFSAESVKGKQYCVRRPDLFWQIRSQRVASSCQVKGWFSKCFFVLLWGMLFNKMNNKFKYCRREEKHYHRLSSRLVNTLLLFSYFHVRIEALLLNLITNNLFGFFF